MELEGVAGLLLKNAANVNAQGEIHGSALQVASTFIFAAIYWIDIARFLLENGANVNVQVQGHERPLEAASRSGAKTIVRLLLDKGAVANHKRMEVASKRGDGEIKDRFAMLWSRSPLVQDPTPFPEEVPSPISMACSGALNALKGRPFNSSFVQTTSTNLLWGLNKRLYCRELSAPNGKSKRGG